MSLTGTLPTPGSYELVRRMVREVAPMLPSGPSTDKPMAKWRTLASVGVLKKHRRRGSRAGTLAVLEALGDSTNFSGTCTLSHNELAARAALSRRSVPRIIRRLEQVPFLGLKVHRFRRPNGVNEVNRYTFNGAVWTTLPLWTAQRTSRPRGDKLSPPVVTNSPSRGAKLSPEERSKRFIKEMPAPASDAPLSPEENRRRFEQLCQRFPDLAGGKLASKKTDGESPGDASGIEHDPIQKPEESKGG